MSYDVTLVAPSGRHLWSRNHTSNTRAMWTQAGCAVADFHGRSAITLGAAAAQAAERLRTDPEAYRHLEPDNRWGTLESCRDFLQAIAEACEDLPHTTVEVDR